MIIASVYDFTAFPPRGGNHVHALQLMRQFMAHGHDVLTWGDSSVPGATAVSRDEKGALELEQRADVLYVRVDANPFGRSPALVSLLEQTKLPTVWEINAPANEALAFSWLGGIGNSDQRLADGLRRRIHAWRQMPAIAREERLRRRLARRVTSATCMSTALARYASTGLRIASTQVIPNGADHEAEHPDGPVAPLPPEFADKLVVLYAGSPMYPWQGLDVLERTIRMCAHEDDPIRFVLLLNQESPRPINTPNVVTYSRVPHTEVSSFVRAADVGVAIHPEYFWSPWRFHGSPMKMFDYMACGTTVVASDLGQMQEIIQPERNGLLFDNTPEGLRSRLLEIAAGQYDLESMARAARIDVETTHNWQAIARRTLEALQVAIEQSRSSR